MKKAAQILAARELLDMSAAETEQRANGIDRFWGIDAMRDAVRNATQAAVQASSAASSSVESVESTIEVIAEWKRLADVLEKEQRKIVEKRDADMKRSHMRHFWARGSKMLEESYALRKEPRRRRHRGKGSVKAAARAAGQRHRNGLPKPKSDARPASSVLGSTISDAKDAVRNFSTQQHIPTLVLNHLRRSLENNVSNRFEFGV